LLGLFAISSNSALFLLGPIPINTQMIYVGVVIYNFTTVTSAI